MTRVESTVGDSNLAGPAPRRKRPPFFEVLRTIRDNMIDIYLEEAFERPLLEVRLLGRRHFILNDPEGIKHVLADHAENYRKASIVRRTFEPGFGKGLLTSEGEIWRAHRRIMAPAFEYRSVAGYAPLIVDVVDKMLARWNSLPAAAAIDIAMEMRDATLQIISQTMFSSDSDGTSDVVKRAVENYNIQIRPNLLDFLGLPDSIAGWNRRRVARRLFAEFDAVIARLIDERRRARHCGPKDLLGRLIASSNETAHAPVAAKDLRYQVITIFMAGHDTTALALTWTWYLLSKHPELEATLHAELNTVLGGRNPEHADLAKLPYTRMVVEESMRLYPPVHLLLREPIAEDRICGQRIPKGSLILIAPWVLHRHRRLWDHPERFDPERFRPSNTEARSRYSYIPFGAGPHICIGATFAMSEAILVLAVIAQHYRLRLVPGHPVEPQGLLTLRPRHGLKMTLERRCERIVDTAASPA